MGRRSDPTVEYLVDEGSGCWVWQRGRTQDGYGCMSLRQPNGSWRTFRAHRVYYERFKGSIPTGLHIDHLCRNRACVNPDHLEAVTQWENTRRSTKVGRNAGHRWSSTEDMLVLAQAIPDRALGKMLGRSQGAVSERRFRLRYDPRICAVPRSWGWAEI